MVGNLDLAYEVAELRGDQDLTMFAYSAEPASPSVDALEIPASWAATRGRTDVPATTGDR